MKPKPLTFEPIQHRQYGLPHGASNPMQAALLSQKHMAEKQNQLIRGGRRTRKTRKPKRRTRNMRKTRRPHQCVCTCKVCRRCRYRKTRTKRKTRKTPNKKRSLNGGTKGGQIIVPHFNEPSNPVSPDGPNTLSKNMNSTYLQGKSNAEYDHMYKAPPRTVDSF